MGVQVEPCAQCCSSRLVPPGGCAGRRHALVPVGCAWQRGPVRVSVSLRTLARRAAQPGGGGCPASPGHRTWWLVQGGPGLGPVPADRAGARGDDCPGFAAVLYGADDHGPAGAVRDGRRLVGEAACRDALPGARVAVALVAAGAADGPFPAGCRGPVGGFAVLQRLEALRAVSRGVPRRHGDHGDTKAH